MYNEATINIKDTNHANAEANTMTNKNSVWDKEKKLRKHRRHKKQMEK